MVDYCNSILTCLSKNSMDQLQLAQNAAAKLPTWSSKFSPCHTYTDLPSKASGIIQDLVQHSFLDFQGFTWYCSIVHLRYHNPICYCKDSEVNGSGTAKPHKYLNIYLRSAVYFLNKLLYLCASSNLIIKYLTDAEKGQ